MRVIKQQLLTGERALFQSQDLQISYSTFADGESPIKESHNVKIDHSMFKWRYPLWYCKNIEVEDCSFFEGARAGIWYTQDIAISNSTIESPKNFRRAKNIKLENVTMMNASESFWSCEHISLKDVTVKGEYFCMNSTDVVISDLNLVGSYSFDGSSNIEIRNSRIISKDAFWNCENVTVYDSFISGEYIGWNSKNLTFVDCTVESLQGMCYIDNLIMKNCRLLNTTLAFEYSTVDVQIDSLIDSVINPAGGVIQAEGIGELIMDITQINPNKTLILTGEMKNAG